MGEHLQSSAEFKAIGETSSGEVEGFANVFAVEGEPFVDLGLDTVKKGAFKRTIRERVKRGLVPLLDSHQWTAEATHGRLIDAEERDGTIRGKSVFGLWFKARFSEADASQQMRQKVLDGTIRALSIGFMPLEEGFKKDDASGRTVRILKQVRLDEVSMVPLPMNEMSEVTLAKSATSFGDLPLAPWEHRWNVAEARERLISKTKSSAALRPAFLEFNRDTWLDRLGEVKAGERPDVDLLDAFSHPIADIDSKGQLVVVPEALVYLALTADDDLRPHLDSYFRKMGVAAPWEGGRFVLGPSGVRPIDALDDLAGPEHSTHHVEPKGDDPKTGSARLAALRLREREMAFTLSNH